MLNTDTTYFHFKACDSLSFLETEKDSFTICPASVPALPYTRLDAHHNLIGNLIFTVLFLIVFAFIRLRGKDLLYNLAYILIKRKKSEIIQNEGISSNLICYLLSLCLSLAVLAITINFIAWQSFLNWNTLYLFTGLFFYHFFLIAIVRLLGWTFNFKIFADEVIINIWTYHILSGLLISPFVIASFFVKNFAILPLTKAVIFCLLVFMSIKFVRWIEILFSYRVSILYMFLYLCALEIMPLLVLYKIVV